ncbi:fungal-specific transcription factor domain-containing protein [Hysterangium stoloniferum]|nr:fungal-specific transcription factor domain-containing protein [Hysterangium stoloniferum]
MANTSKRQKLDTSGESPGDPSKPLPLQRRRVWRACESCRRKKIKCDGREPTCGQCAMSKTSCTWIQTKDRAALSRHYVQELEQRLLHMESLLAKVVGQSQEATSADRPVGDASRHSPPSTRSAPVATTSTVSSPSQASDNSHDNEMRHPATVKQEDDEDGQVRDQLGQLALDDHGHLRWIGSSSTMSLIQSFRALTSEPVDRYMPFGDDLPADSMGNLLYFPSGLGFGKVRALPGPQEVEYPDRDLADKLVEAYFAHLHFQLPVVHKPTFLQQYEELMNMSISERADTGYVSVLFGVFACAARIVNDQRLISEGGNGGMAMVYYERAMILYYIGHSNTQVAQVQCFVILSSFLCSVNCLPQAWLLVGQAVRIGQDLGLHRTPKHLALSATDKQTRRKVWWSVYTLDRMLAIALGRPFGVDDRDCDTEFPLQVDDDHLQAFFDERLPQQTTPSPMVGFVALSALFKIGGEVMRRVYSVRSGSIADADMHETIDDLDAQLTDWCDRLPPAFKYLTSNDQQTRIGSTLASSYYAILITLHRKCLSPRRIGRTHVLPGSNSASKAVQSARACIRLAPSAKDVIPPSHHLAFFIQFLSTSAVIVLLFAMHAPDDVAAAAAMGEVQGSLAILQALEGQWPGARKCAELLESLVEVARGVMKHGDDKGNNQPTASSAGLQTQVVSFSHKEQGSPVLSREGNLLVTYSLLQS